jgi:hypothetical protein
LCKVVAGDVSSRRQMPMETMSMEKYAKVTLWHLMSNPRQRRSWKTRIGPTEQIRAKKVQDAETELCSSALRISKIQVLRNPIGGECPIVTSIDHQNLNTRVT